MDARVKSVHDESNIGAAGITWRPPVALLRTLLFESWFRWCNQGFRFTVFPKMAVYVGNSRDCLLDLVL
jgi:hypothetical protein